MKGLIIISPPSFMCVGSKFHNRIYTCWKHRCRITIVALLLFLLVFPAISIYCSSALQFSLTNQTIAIGQTIILQPMGYLNWCKGISVSQHTIKSSDYYPGFLVSAYLVDSSSVKTESYVVDSASGRYPGTNQTIDYGKQRYLEPLDYYSDPLYFLKGSTIILESVIHLPKEAANTLSSAIVYLFDSKKVAVNYQKEDASSVQKQVHHMNITDCINNVCTRNYTVEKNSFYFFVLYSESTSGFMITLNFTFQVLRFVHPSLHYGAWNVANISKNAPGFIPFQEDKDILLYPNAPNDTDARRLSHLNATCVPRYWLHAVVFIISCMPLTVYLLVLLLCCCCSKASLLRCYHRMVRRRETFESTSPLLGGSIS